MKYQAFGITHQAFCMTYRALWVLQDEVLFVRGGLYTDAVLAILHPELIDQSVVLEDGQCQYSLKTCVRFNIFIL